jgi:hypothetical protein
MPLNLAKAPAAAGRPCRAAKNPRPQGLAKVACAPGDPAQAHVAARRPVPSMGMTGVSARLREGIRAGHE